LSQEALRAFGEKGGWGGGKKGKGDPFLASTEKGKRGKEERGEAQFTLIIGRKHHGWSFCREGLREEKGCIKKKEQGQISSSTLKEEYDP